jgi:hypothetical protein
MGTCKSIIRILALAPRFLRVDIQTLVTWFICQPNRGHLRSFPAPFPQNSGARRQIATVLHPPAIDRDDKPTRRLDAGCG